MKLVVSAKQKGVEHQDPRAEAMESLLLFILKNLFLPISLLGLLYKSIYPLGGLLPALGWSAVR